MYKRILVIVSTFCMVMGMASLQASVANQGKVTSQEYLHIIDDSNFDELTSSGVTVLDFYADWCAPCRQFMPTFKSVAVDMKGKARFGKVNLDHARQTVKKVGVKSIPTIVIIKDGKEVNRRVGGCSSQELKTMIQSVL